MLTIHKFPLAGDGVVSMPRGARVVRVASQHGEPMLWAEVDTYAPMEARRFAICGTGQSRPPGAYLGTYDSPPFVWHVYEPLVRAADDGWQEWAGGDEPPEGARGKVVDVRWRDGRVSSGPAATWRWSHEGGAYDLVAYRIAAEQPES